MQILVTHAYTKENRGDAAILTVLLMQLSEAFKGAKIKISTFDDIHLNKTFEGYENISSFLYLIVFKHKNKIIKAIYSTYLIVFTILWAIIFEVFDLNLSFILTSDLKQIAEEFYKSDLIVPIGGGYIRSKPTISDTINLFLVLHPILLAIIFKKPIILYSQSIGPFYNNFQKIMVRTILNRVNLIMAREDRTVKTLAEIGVRKDLIVRTVDAGFLFKPKSRLTLKEFSNGVEGKIVVGVTVRRWLAPKKQARYEQEMAMFIDKTSKNKKLVFVFIPQVASSLHNDDDREVALRIIKLIKNKKAVINLDYVDSHHDIKKLYGGLDYIVGTRFHSVIFSLTSDVPALAIEYEYKTSGIMADLGLSSWVIPIEDVNEKILTQKFNDLIKNKKMYKEKLSRNLPSYIQKVEKNVKYLRETYAKVK